MAILDSVLYPPVLETYSNAYLTTDADTFPSDLQTNIKINLDISQFNNKEEIGLWLLGNEEIYDYNTYVIRKAVEVTIKDSQNNQYVFNKKFTKGVQLSSIVVDLFYNKDKDGNITEAIAKKSETSE